MTSRSLFRYLSASALTILIALPAAAQNIVGKDKTGPVPNPVNLDTAGLFQDKFVTVGDDMFIGGQPTEKALRELKGARYLRGGDGVGGRQGAPALHHRVAGEPSLGGVSHS